MAVHGVIPGGGGVSPAGDPGREEEELLEAQVVHHLSPDKRLVVALGEVGDGVGGVWLVVHTPRVQVRRLDIVQVPGWISNQPSFRHFNINMYVCIYNRCLWKHTRCTQ